MPLGTVHADTITGGEGGGRLLGRDGNDFPDGGFGDDQLFSGLSRDRLDGGAGDDALHGSDGRDTLTGGVGNDDAVHLLSAGFGGLAVGQLVAGRFVARGDNLAQDGNDRFIFDTVKTELWSDRNGDRAGGLTLLADMQAGATMTAGNVFLI